MSADADREARRLMKRHRIFFKPSIDSVPKPRPHEETFNDIITLGGYKFDSYRANITPRLNEEPWRKQTTARAEWLSNRAAELVEQERNEAGWRLGLENHVLLRFQSEVAW
jgi:hypothetical protein